MKLRVELPDLAGARQELEEHVRQDNRQPQGGTVGAGQGQGRVCDVVTVDRQEAWAAVDGNEEAHERLHS